MRGFCGSGGGGAARSAAAGVSSRRRRGEGGWLSLLGLLAALVIMALLAIYLLGGPEAFRRGGTGGKGTLPGLGGVPGGAVAVMGEAKEEVCRNNLQQIRYALQMALGSEEGSPSSLEELARAHPGLQLRCPAGGETYQYDAGSGRVWCPHPGHERL